MITAIPFPLNRQQHLMLRGPAGQLKVLTTHPTESLNPAPAVAVICHPHPLFGGTMSNKVITTLARAFDEMGFSTVRFNFRGVDGSEGEYDQGLGESDDLLAILQWLKAACPGQPIWLAGFSFGAYVAAQGAKLWPVEQLICVAPPIENFPFKSLPPFPCPWLLIQGDQDEVVSPAAVFAWAESLDNPPPILKIKDATHFFHGQLIQLREQLIATLPPRLKTS